MCAMSQTAFAPSELQVPVSYQEWFPNPSANLESGDETLADALLSVRDAASRLGVHENTVRNWIVHGQLNAYQLPGSGFRRIPSVEVERLRSQFLGALAPAKLADPAPLPPGTSIDLVPGDG